MSANPLRSAVPAPSKCSGDKDYDGHDPKEIKNGKSKTGRNIIICMDGTSNKFGEKNTNVVEFYSRLEKDPDTQITFYNSGIGTYATPSWRSWEYYKQVLWHKIDLAIAWRFERILLSAYLWLSENYVKGDRIFVLGFSRGAYQARALSAMIEAVGLIHKGNEDQIPFAYQLYAETNPSVVARHAADEVAPPDDNEHAAAEVRDVSTAQPIQAPLSMKQRFKETFSRSVRVHFVGAWDTVSSVGLVRDKNLPGTTDGMKHVCYFRHALALHELRVKFLPEYANGGLGPNPEDPSPTPHTKEVWFAGSHSDIGGGSGENQNLDRFGPSLRWMSFEAVNLGLKLKQVPRKWEEPKISRSLSGFWMLLEYLPITRLSYTGKEETEWWPHLASARTIQPGQMIHETAIDSMDEGRATVHGHGSWSAFTRNETVIERDPYAAANRIVAAMTKRAKESQPLTREELSDLSTLTSTEAGRQSLLDINDEVGTPIADILLASILAPDDGDPTATDLRTVTGTLTEVLQVFSRRYPPSKLRRAVRAIAAKDSSLAASFMAQFSDPLQGRLEGHTSSVMCVSFFPSGKRVVTASQDGSLRIWDVETRKTVLGPLQDHYDTVRWVDVSPDETRIASCAYDSTFRIWDALTGELLLGPVTGHEHDDLEYVAFSRDGLRIATCAEDRTIRIWDASTGAQVLVMTDASPSMSLCFFPDDRRLVSGSQNGFISVWDSTTGARILGPLVGHTRWIYSVLISPDASRVFSCSGDGTIRIRNSDTGEMVGEPIEAHDDQVLSIAVSPDGKRLVSGGDDGSIRLWDAESASQIIVPFKSHQSGVWSVAFSPDGRRIASASMDGTVALWDATDDWLHYDI